MLLFHLFTYNPTNALLCTYVSFCVLRQESSLLRSTRKIRDNIVLSGKKGFESNGGRNFHFAHLQRMAALVNHESNRADSLRDVAFTRPTNRVDLEDGLLVEDEIAERRRRRRYDARNQ